MVTADHDPAPDDVVGGLVSDADLAVLGGTPAGYARYTHQVRAEYCDVPDPLFRAGRSQVLRTLLDGGPLFRTAPGVGPLAGRGGGEPPRRADGPRCLTRLTGLTRHGSQPGTVAFRS